MQTMCFYCTLGSDRPKLAVRLHKSRLQLFYPRGTRFTTHRPPLQVFIII